MRTHFEFGTVFQEEMAFKDISYLEVWQHIPHCWKSHVAAHMLPAYIFCCLYLLTLLTDVHVSVETNSVDLDLVWFGSALFVKEASKTFQQPTKQTTCLVVIETLRCHPVQYSSGGFSKTHPSQWGRIFSPPQPHPIHHIYISCWLPVYRWSVMDKQVTSTPPIPGNGGVLVTCIYITDHL